MRFDASLKSTKLGSDDEGHYGRIIHSNSFLGRLLIGLTITTTTTGQGSETTGKAINVYTSFMTGRPKRVMLTLGILMHETSH
jgi:hypothetical protein